MKRALAVVVVAVAACSRGPAPAAFEVIVRASGGGRDAAATDAEIAVPLLRELGQTSGIGDLSSRVEGDELTIVVLPKHGVDEHTLLEQVPRALAGAERLLPADLMTPPTYLAHELPESSIWFAGGAGSADTADALAQIAGVREVNACGVADDEPVLELDLAKLHAYGLDLEQLRAAVGAAGPGVKLLDVPVGLARVGDVAHVREPRRNCVVASSSGAAPGPAVFEARGRDVHRDELAAVAARAGLRPLDAAQIYVSRVRYEGGGPAMVDAARELARAAGSADGVAWAVTEAVPDEGTARLVIGLRDGEPAARAVDAARRATEGAGVPSGFDSLGGMVELELVLQPRDASHVSANAEALAALAKLRARGVPAGCDGCTDGARLAPRYEVDREMARRLGIGDAAIAHALAALSPDGTWLGDVRVVVAGDGASRVGALELPGAGSAEVPMSAIARVTTAPTAAYLRSGELPAAAVWVRAGSEAEARAALATVAPDGRAAGIVARDAFGD